MKYTEKAQSKEEVYRSAQSRYVLEYHDYRRLQREHIRFEEEYVKKFRGPFISRILMNYLCYAQENFRDEFESNIAKCFSEKRYNDKAYEGLVSFNAKLADKFCEFDFVKHPLFNKRAAVIYILRRFIRLPFSDREMVYCYPEYKVIVSALEDNLMLRLELGNGDVYEVRPYSVMVDENSYSYYLIGYSRIQGSDEDFVCGSFKLSRIKGCKVIYEEGFLSSKEKSEISRIYNKFGAAYIYMTKSPSSSELQKVVVRLSYHGYNELFLKIITHQRPIPCKEPVEVQTGDNTFYDVTFDCSFSQIRNYFFSFGEHAEVLEPEILREQFIGDYENALKTYQSANVDTEMIK